MPTSTDEAPAPEKAPRGGLGSKLSAVAIVAASIGTIGILFLFLTSRNDQITVVQPVPEQQDPAQDDPAQQAPATRAPAPGPESATVAPPLPPPARPTVASPASSLPSASAGPAFDGQGFIDSQARCGSGEDAVVIARTSRAAIVICDRDGDYTYRGVRLEDGAFLRLDDVRPMPAGFEARNDATTYRLSPTELVVISGETLQSRDAMVEYQAS